MDMRYRRDECKELMIPTDGSEHIVCPNGHGKLKVRPAKYTMRVYKEWVSAEKFPSAHEVPYYKFYQVDGVDGKWALVDADKNIEWTEKCAPDEMLVCASRKNGTARLRKVKRVV